MTGYPAEFYGVSELDNPVSLWEVEKKACITLCESKKRSAFNMLLVITCSTARKTPQSSTEKMLATPSIRKAFAKEPEYTAQPTEDEDFDPLVYNSV